MLQFTNINHIARRKLDITWLEYGLADMIHNLSGTHSPVSGWCIMSRPKMAEEIGVSKRTVITYIQHLIDLGLIEKNPDTDYLRSTKKWYKMTQLTDGVQNLHGGGEKVARVGVQNLHGGGEKVAPYNNINIDIDNNTELKRSAPHSDSSLILNDIPDNAAEQLYELVCTAPLEIREQWKRDGSIKTDSLLKTEIKKFAEWQTNLLVEKAKEYELAKMLQDFRQSPKRAQLAFGRIWIRNRRNHTAPAEEQTVFITTGLNT